ncbi:MAG: oxaloacetate decarboxylase subunit alpha [Firmicutes bacterium]|nr:oxaloacetate decarboxylase subunit alpha [Bacillota bacterium]
MDTTLRDGHQSLWATRMKTEDMFPVLEMLDQVGFAAIEMWGGATFDSCLRYLNEDPWNRLRLLRKMLPNTKLQMLLRGQNLVGYRHYADDVVTEFVKRTVDNGMDIIRVFDGLNDIRNMELPMRVAKEAGAHVQGTMVYSISPVHNLDSYVKFVKELLDVGIDSLCIKDMAGILTPYEAYNLVKRLKEFVDVPIQLHTHYTSGMASMTYLKAIEAGVDIIDCAQSPLALGTSQPATETLVAVLQGTPYDTGLDLKLLSDISEKLKEIKAKYPQAKNVSVYQVDANVLRYQIPGGMISNFISQLGDQLHLLPKVFEEVPRVREDLGYPPLVTPFSQIVGSQALMNVLAGERYKMVSNEVKNYLRGHYGRAPGPIDEEFRRRIIGDAEVITVRPADLLEPELEAARKEVALYMEKEEDVLSYALFQQVALNYLKERESRKYNIDFDLIEKTKGGYPV